MAPLAVVEFLVNKHPAAVKQRDSSGALPIHLAIEGGIAQGVPLFLLKKYPESVKMKRTHKPVRSRFGASIEATFVGSNLL